MMMHEKRGATQNYVDKDVGECALGGCATKQTRRG
jgi:hypothetical protein